jgi:8-oxo-dGTP pyrophosphatase MutT (NUDIX family)
MPAAAAVRELAEETRLALDLTPVPEAAPSADVAVYVARASADAAVLLDDEHDAFRWLPLAEAVAICLPAEVGACLTNASAWLDAGAR